MTEYTNALSERRVGRIAVDREFLYEIPQRVIGSLLAGAIITRCEHRFLTNTFEYELAHPHFPTVEEGVVIPMYRFTVTGLYDLDSSALNGVTVAINLVNADGADLDEVASWTDRFDDKVEVA